MEKKDQNAEGKKERTTNQVVCPNQHLLCHLIDRVLLVFETWEQILPSER